MTRITTYAEVDEVLRSRDFVQARPAVGPFLTGTIGTLDGDEHFERRRLESAVFRPRLLGSHEDMAAAVLGRQLRAGRARPVRADVVSLVRDALLPVAVRLVGLDEVATPERVKRLEA